MKVAYIMSRFPNLTETFVLNEIVALERQGVATTVYPLLKTSQRVVHPDATELVERAHYQPFFSVSILVTNFLFLCRRPRAYLGVLLEVLRATWGSANFFVGAIGIFPKVVRFAHEMEEEQVTHVHAHFANHPTVAALIIHRLTGIPFSFTAHGHDVHVDRRMLDRKCAAASFVVMISSYNKQLVLNDFPHLDPHHLHLIHCGVDTKFFTPRREARSEGPFALICVGSFIEVKGHEFLVEACRLLKDRGLTFRCDLVGSGPDQKLVEARIEMAGLGDEFVIHGAQPRDRVAELIAAADVIVQPSAPTKRGSREGIPVSLMEGMACGLPVVASAISGIPELVVDERTGFLVPPRDPVVLADVLERLIRTPELRKRLGSAGRDRVRESFDLARNAARLCELIQNASRNPQTVNQQSIRAAKKS